MIDGNDISQAVQKIVEFYLPDGGSIHDPTSGSHNHQFSWIKKRKNYLYTTSKSNVRTLKRRRKSDMVWYDPPFTPSPTIDRRKSHYGNTNYKPKYCIGMYSKGIIDNLVAISNKYLVIRGQDFFYPPQTLKFYKFSDTIKTIMERKDLIFLGEYVFPFKRHDHNYIRKIIKRLSPVINHSYIEVFYID